MPTLHRNVLELLSRGVSVDLVCITWGSSPAPPGLRVYSIRIKPRRSHALWYPAHYIAFFAWALLAASILSLRHRYDAVQVDTLPDFLVFTTVVPRLRGMRVVLYVMELMPELTMARLRVGKHALLVRLAARLERAATSWATRVIAVSNTVSRVVASRGLDAAKVTVVPNSHPVHEFPPRQQPAQPPFLVLQTTLIARYGVAVAIQALALLHEEWPELTLHVIGDGEERPTLIALAERLGLSRHVILSAGFRPWRETMERVRQATLGIVPILADGYGELVLSNKILEFAALEVPAVCSRLRGFEEHFPDDAVAYFTPGDAMGLAAQARRLLRHPEEARQQAQRARLAVADLAWESASGAYLEALGLTPDRIMVSHAISGPARVL
jgi:glycosyltransferase involved in cell wall biosynthesis